jgi:hypothetical protein
MGPMLLVQQDSTRADERRVIELDAAEAGINVAVGQIRAASDGSGNGVLSLLPCGQLSGTADAVNGSRYLVTVTYYTSDPSTQSSQWLTANAVTCVAGAGARNTPSYGLLQSYGTNTSTGAFGSVPTRYLQATYIFQTTNQNIPGGLIHVYKTSTSTDLCLDAGSGSPTVATIITVQPCSSGSAQQTWKYTSSLTVTLGSTNLCIDAGTPQSSGLVLKLQNCVSPVIPQQQWSFNDSANFSGTSDGLTLDSYCWNVQNQNVAGSTIVLSTNCNSGYDNIQNFSPEAAVGAGASGAATGQLVNFNQFGRCLDVTNQDPTSTFLIDWPCKQAPDPNNITWNQRWTLPTATGTATSASGQITTNDTANTTKYCLQSPLSTAAGQYVTVQPCPSVGTPTNMNWTVYGNSGTYSTSYQITDNSGNCLQPTDPNAVPPDLFTNGNNVSKLIVQNCSGSTLQKWNAPPNILTPLPLKNIGEK